MTQEELDVFKLLNDEQYIERKRFQKLEEDHKERMWVLSQMRSNLSKKCDHKYPNGRSAVSGMFMYSSCEICGWCDL